jgi:hypothetical protein
MARQSVWATKTCWAGEFTRAQKTTKEDLATLYRARWHNELDLQSIKSTMQMRELRCKTPELVRKEIWASAAAGRAENRRRTMVASEFRSNRMKRHWFDSLFKFKPVSTNT